MRGRNRLTAQDRLLNTGQLGRSSEVIELTLPPIRRMGQHQRCRPASGECPAAVSKNSGHQLGRIERPASEHDGIGLAQPVLDRTQTILKVSRLCLGMMTYGSTKWREWVLEEEEAKPFVKRALDAGINFFDTADVYSLGESERSDGQHCSRPSASNARMWSSPPRSSTR